MSGNPPTAAHETVEGTWWHQAACVGRDPSWWSDRSDTTQAVRVCLECPVRQQCLADAIAHRDDGVIRGGMWLTVTSRHYSVTSLICGGCGVRPVSASRGNVARYCGPTCRASSAATRRTARRGAAATV